MVCLRCWYIYFKVDSVVYNSVRDQLLCHETIRFKGTSDLSLGMPWMTCGVYTGVGSTSICTYLTVYTCCGCKLMIASITVTSRRGGLLFVCTFVEAFRVTWIFSKSSHFVRLLITSKVYCCTRSIMVFTNYIAMPSCATIMRGHIDGLSTLSFLPSLYPRITHIINYSVPSNAIDRKLGGARVQQYFFLLFANMKHEVAHKETVQYEQWRYLALWM